MYSENIAGLLASGAMNSSALQTALANNAKEAGFMLLCQDRFLVRSVMESSAGVTAVLGSALAKAILLTSESAMTTIAESDRITELLVSSAAGALTIVDTDLFLYYRRSYNNYRLLKQFINASGSKLKKQTFTSSGTFTLPGSGLAGLYIVGVGKGGTGASTGTRTGGGGAETKGLKITSLPVSNQTVTIGSGAATVGAIFSAAAGQNGADGGAGGGTTSGLSASLLDKNILDVPWYQGDFTVKGGDGGDNAGNDGEAGFSGSGGIANGATGGAGTGIGSGGAGSTSDAGAGVNAGTTDYGCGGGAGGSSGGTGNNGAISCMYVEND